MSVFKRWVVAGMALLAWVEGWRSDAQALDALAGRDAVRLRWTNVEAALESRRDLVSGNWVPVTLAVMSMPDGSREVTVPYSDFATSFYRVAVRDGGSGGAGGRLAYDVGRPEWHDWYVDAEGGRDDADGRTRATAFRTLGAAFRNLPPELPAVAARIRLMPGVHRGAYLEDRRGTATHPILIEPADGPGTATFRPTPSGDQGSLQFLNCAYVYLQDFAIRVDGGDALQFERCDHMLVRRMVIASRRSDAQNETVKLNQSRHVYVEDSDISGAGDNCIDAVAVQWGHLVRCRIHDAQDWLVYLKGGSAYWRVEANELYGGGTGGFTAGQGTGFQFMTPPWLHYEAYDIKVVNNVIRDCDGAGLGVNGGYNILMAHNTLYRVGSRSHGVEFVLGRRGCDGMAVADCEPYRSAGGWGDGGEEGQYIPNRHVWFLNNVLLNPPGFRSEYQHFEIAGPAQPPAGSNIPSPARADDDLRIAGNWIFNGPDDLLLGNEDGDAGCQEGDCRPEALRQLNRINVGIPELVNPQAGDFRPVAGGNLARWEGVRLESFGWQDAPSRPAVPAGELRNEVPVDRVGAPRSGSPIAGALLP